MARFQAGSAYVQVLPSLRGFHSRITTEVKSTFPNGLTIDIKPRFDPGTVRAQAKATASGAGQTIKFRPEIDRSGLAKVEAEVAATADRLAKARDVEADAAGRVRVAEERLKEVRSRAKASAAQLAAAEEQLAAAKRKGAAASEAAAKLERDLSAARERVVTFKAELDSAQARAEADVAARGMAETVKFKVDLDKGSLASSIIGVAALSRALKTLALPAALVAITPAAVSAASSLTQAAGAALLLPAGLAAGGAAAATLIIGLSGVGDTLKAMSKADEAAGATAVAAGKARAAAAEQVRNAQNALAEAQRNADRVAIQGAQQVADAQDALADTRIQAARQVADAQQDLREANEDLRRAQDDLNQAWEDGRRELEDFAFSLRDAVIDEAEAVDQLEEARARLAEARARGAGAEEIDDLTRAVAKAELSVDRAATRMRRLREEEAEWARTGIAGSQAVVSAQERSEAAAQRVRDAEANLARARIDQRRDIADAERALAQTVQQAAWAQQDATRAVAEAQAQVAAALAATSAAGSAAADKAAAGMAKLSPAAQNLVNTLRSLGPAWTALRLDVQERLLAGVGNQVRALAGIYLPILQTSLGRTATGFNTAFTATSDFYRLPGTAADIALGMNNVSIGLTNAAGASRPLAQAFTDIFAVGSTFLPAMGAGVASLAQRFADFIAHARETGQLRIWIQQSIDVLRQLGSIAGNVGSILFSMFGAARGSGESFLAMLDRITGSMAANLKTPEGAAGLRDFFTTTRVVVGLFVDKLVQLWPVATAAGGALAALLVAASPLSSVLFTLVTTALVPLLRAVEFLAPVLGPALVLFGAWRAATWLGTGALVAWRTAVALSTAISVAWQLAMGTNLVLTNAQAAAQARFTVVKYAGVAATYVITAAQWLWNTSLWASAGAMLMTTIRTLAFVGIMGAYYTVIGLVRVATLIWTGAQWLLNAALSANPIGIVVVLLAGLVAAIVWAWHNSETFRNVVLAVWDGIKVAFNLGWALVKWVLDSIIAGLRFVGSIFVWFWQSVILPVWEGIKTAFQIGGAVIDFIFAAIKFGLETVKARFWLIVDAIGEAWGRLRGFLAKPVNFMIDVVWNRGILSAWNAVARFLPGIEPIRPLGLIPEHRTGGPIRGPGTGTSDDVLMFGSNGEHMWTDREVRAVGGHRQVEELRAAALDGTLAYYRDGGPIIPGYQGGGPIYQQLFSLVRGAFPQANLNSGYRPGDPGFHGRSKAVDLGQRGRSGGLGHPYLADMNRWIHDRYGKGSAELIYTGFGDDRPDVYRGRPHTYNPGTRAGHRNHVHWAVNNMADLGGGGLFGAIGGAIGAVVSYFRDKVADVFRTITDPLGGLIDRTVGVPPPAFRAVPRAMFEKFRGAALQFLLGKADEQDAASGAVGLGGYGKGAPFYVREIARAGRDSRVGRAGNVIGVATALVESGLRMYANRRVPGSLNFPHEAIGSDHDSVGLFQQRQAGWGTLAERMNPYGSAKLFYNALNRFNWRAMAPGAAAQRVQRSAFPGRYATRMGEAGRLLDIHAGGGFDEGGWMPPGFGVYNNRTRKPEPVFSDEQWRAIKGRVAGGDGGVVNNWYVQETTDPESTALKIARRQAFDSRLG